MCLNQQNDTLAVCLLNDETAAELIDLKTQKHGDFGCTNIIFLKLVPPPHSGSLVCKWQIRRKVLTGSCSKASTTAQDARLGNFQTWKKGEEKQEEAVNKK